MRDDPAFIRSIAAAPDDDAPRLIYSDYLEETGNPLHQARAEFIRVQIEKTQRPSRSPRWNELWWSEIRLLGMARRWRAELPAIEGVHYDAFFRGFIDAISCTASGFLQNPRMLFDSVPVRRLHLYAIDVDSVEAIVATEELQQVFELDISINQLKPPTMLRALAELGPWPRLKSLRVAWASHHADRQNIEPRAWDSAIWQIGLEEVRKAFGNLLV